MNNTILNHSLNTYIQDGQKLTAQYFVNIPSRNYITNTVRMNGGKWTVNEVVTTMSRITRVKQAASYTVHHPYSK